MAEEPRRVGDGYNQQGDLNFNGGRKNIMVIEKMKILWSG